MNNLYNNLYQPYASYMPRPYDVGGRFGGQEQIKWVLGVENAKSYPLRPGDSIVLLDSEQLRCYVKTCDVNGMCNLKAYDLVEPVAAPASTPIDTSQFVTRKELNDILQPLQAAAAPVPTETKSKTLL